MSFQMWWGIEAWDKKDLRAAAAKNECEKELQAAFASYSDIESRLLVIYRRRQDKKSLRAALTSELNISCALFDYISEMDIFDGDILDPWK